MSKVAKGPQSRRAILGTGLLVLGLVACKSVEASAGSTVFLPRVTRGGGTSAPTPTHVGIATPTPTPDRSPTPAATATPAEGPVTLNYIYDLNVDPVKLQLIKDGIGVVQKDLTLRYGGDQQRPVGSQIDVRVVATGLGNPDPNAHGSCCTALNSTGPYIYLDTINSGYPKLQIDQKRNAGNEYTRTWENSFPGCFTYDNQPLGNWMNSGIAQIVPTQALVGTGELDNKVARYQEYFWAYNDGTLALTLDQVNTSGKSAEHIGYLALEYLVSTPPQGSLSLKILCESIASGSLDQAWLKAFNTTANAFNPVFEQYKQNLANSPVYLVQLGGPLPPDQIPAGMSGPTYLVGVAAYGDEKYTSAQKLASWRYPSGVCNTVSNEPGLNYISFCNTPPGQYPLTKTMLDGRTATINMIIA